jgi:hypothetical protein
MLLKNLAVTYCCPIHLFYGGKGMKTNKRILLALLYSLLVFFFCSGSTSCSTNYSDPANAIDVPSIQ